MGFGVSLELMVQGYYTCNGVETLCMIVNNVDVSSNEILSLISMIITVNHAKENNHEEVYED